MALWVVYLVSAYAVAVVLIISIALMGGDVRSFVDTTVLATLLAGVPAFGLGVALALSMLYWVTSVGRTGHAFFMLIVAVASVVRSGRAIDGDSYAMTNATPVLWFCLIAGAAAGIVALALRGCLLDRERLVLR